MSNIELKVYGARGGSSVGSREYMEFGGDTSSFTIRHNGTLHLLDAGTGIRRAIAEQLTPEVQEAFLYLTHGHADHVGTGLGRSDRIYNNHLPEGIKVVGYKHVRRALERFFDGDTLWPLSPDKIGGLNKEIIALEGGETLERKGHRVSTLRNYHSNLGHGGSIGFRFDVKNGVTRSIAYVTDMEFDYKPGCQPQELADQLRREFVGFVSDADVLVADTEYTRDEYHKTKPYVRGWGHPPIEDVIDLANQADVKLVMGMHHNTDHTDEALRNRERLAREYARATGFRGEFVLARQGDSIKI